MSRLTKRWEIFKFLSRGMYHKEEIIYCIFRKWKTTTIILEPFKTAPLDLNSKKMKSENKEATNVENSRLHIHISDLKKKVLQNKVDIHFFKQILYHIVNGKEEADENHVSVEVLLLMMVIIHKNYAFYKEQVPSHIYSELNSNFLNRIKLKLHYLYTCKMVIYTMNMLIALELINNDILDFYVNKCYYFLKSEEYKIDDLIHFLSIFGKINSLKQKSHFSYIKKLNYPLIKILCDKITYHFNKLFDASIDYKYAYNLKKEIDQQINELSDQNQKQRAKQNQKQKYKQNVTKYNIYPMKEETRNTQNHTNNTNDTLTTLDSQDKTLLELGVSICRSLKDLKYVHISLINELINALEKTFTKWKKKNIIMDDIISANPIFLIMQYLLFLQLDHHMFYKYIINTFKDFLPSLTNLELFFFLLGKNKLFPNKTIHIFDKTFVKNIKEEIYNPSQLILILDAYSLHNYRNTELISILLPLLFSKWEKNTTQEWKADAKFRDSENRSTTEVIKVLYLLFKLDVYEEHLIRLLNEHIRNEQWIHMLDYKLLINMLLSICYFSYENDKLYNMIIKKLITLDILLDNVYLTKLKICELAIRTQHVPNVLNNMDKECSEYLTYIKNKEQLPELHMKSSLQTNVKNILLAFNLNISEENPIGPYTVDFAEIEKQEQSWFLFSKQKKKTPNEHTIEKKEKLQNVETKPLIIEVDGENHFYKNTKCYISLSKLKHKLLSDLGYTVVNVPYFHWAQLQTDLDKKAYIKKRIADCSNLEITNILPLNQKNIFLKNAELDTVRDAIHGCQERTHWIRSIQKLRNKRKLNFLRRKRRHILASINRF